MIQIYTQQNCPDCIRAKTFFDRLEIPYNCIDITHNTKMRKYVTLELEVYTTPAIVIDQNIVAGFKEKEILSLLKKEK